MEPINYLQNVADPFAQALSGLKFGQAVAAQQQEQELIKQKQLQQQQYQQALARLQLPTATAADFENVMMISGKDQAETLKNVLSARTTRQNQADIGRIAPIAFAIKTGNTDEAISLMNEARDAAANSGDAQDAQYFSKMSELAKTQPENVGNLFATKMTLIPGGKDALDNLLKLTQERRTESSAIPALQTAKAGARKAEAEAVVAEGTQQAKIDEAIATARKAQIEIKTLEAQRNAELSKAQSDADIAKINAKYAEQIAKADLTAKNAQAFASGAAAQASKASAKLTEQQTLKLKNEIARGPLPQYSEKLGGFVVAPTKENPNGGFLPLNAAADVKQQKSAVNALKSAGYDPETGEDRISRLISQSTSGSVQAYTTALLNSIAISTSGSKAIKELESTANSISLDLLDGKIGAGISNADRDFIVGTLGDVANPKTPAGDRLAAWNAARNRMIVSGMLPPPQKVKPEGSFGEPTTPNPAKAAAVRSQADAILRGEK